MDKHVTEPAEKNEFLTDLQQLDSGKMETKVLCVAIYHVLNSTDL